MAITPNQDPIDEFSAVGPDATAAFEPAGSPANPTEHASSENVEVAGRKSGLDEEDEVEDDEDELVADDEDDDLEDDDEEEDEDEDDELEDDDDDLEDDDEDDEDDDDEEEEEDDEEDEDEVAPKKK